MTSNEHAYRSATDLDVECFGVFAGICRNMFVRPGCQDREGQGQDYSGTFIRSDMVSCMFSEIIRKYGSWCGQVSHFIYRDGLLKRLRLFLDIICVHTFFKTCWNTCQEREMLDQRETQLLQACGFLDWPGLDCWGLWRLMWLGWPFYRDGLLQAALVWMSHHVRTFFDLLRKAWPGVEW